MWTRLEAMQTRLKTLEDELCLPEVIADLPRYRELARERSELEAPVGAFQRHRKLTTELDEAERMQAAEKEPELREYLTEEITRLKEALVALEEELTLMLTPRDPFADKNIIMEIRAGAGGEEAALFAGDLLKMYLRLAESRGWKTEIMNAHDTGLGGYKEVTFSIKGSEVYPQLKFESGVHRVQRVPVTEAGGRIHTSTVTVAVLPEAEEFDVEVNPTELRIDTYRSSGAGGQHVNKTDSAVRITHLPSGLVVACQDERSQHQNREKAMRILRAKLLEMRQREHEESIARERREQVGTGDRSEKIRTYNYPQSRVTDHRIGLSVQPLEDVMEGNLNRIIEGLRNDEHARLLKAG